MSEKTMSHNVICPRCGYEELDSSELFSVGQGDGDTVAYCCASCGAALIVTMRLAVEYQVED